MKRENILLKVNPPKAPKVKIIKRKLRSFIARRRVERKKMSKLGKSTDTEDEDDDDDDEGNLVFYLLKASLSRLLFSVDKKKGNV